VKVPRARRALAAALSLAAALLPAARAEEAQDLLPDLVQRPPYKLGLEQEGDRWRIIFASAVENHGKGPLVIEGSRRNRKTPEMRADQVIVRSDGSLSRVEGVGALRFVVSSDHRHWHVIGFDRFELRRAHNFKLLLRDRKTGFCLGDRYSADPAPGAVPEFLQSRCGLDRPRLLRVREGITPGFGDDYKPSLEGQYLDVTGLATGRYVLTHRANSDRKILESDYGNNAASILLRLDWQDGEPRVKVLIVCPGAERCEAPPGA
jgi:hypothetical protein